MVYYFESTDGHIIYMGKDKFENELLIQHGWPIDVWFHADDYSSAHVYLRLQEGETFDTISQSALQECCQITKQGSIEGSKQDQINIVYTPWSNLKKTPGMDVGQVGYHDEKMRKLVHNVIKDKPVLNKLVKTKKEEYPNLQELKDDYVNYQAKVKMEKFKQDHKQKQQQQQYEKEQADIKSYKGFFENAEYKSNKEVDEDDDFM